MTKLQNKGKQFEQQVGEILRTLENKYPAHVQVNEQPKFTLNDGQTVIPDFEIEYHMLYEKSAYLIECQNRKKSSPQIAQKIRYIKGLSTRNRFMFLHKNKITESTRSALESDGVLVLSFEEFVSFISKLELQLRSQKELEKSKELDYDEDLTKPYGIDPATFPKPPS